MVKLFVVSVVTTLKDEITDAVSLEKTPQVITNNIKTTIASELNENSITYTKMRPSIEEIRSQLAKPENPAFSIDSLTTSTIELPGVNVLEPVNIKYVRNKKKRL